MYHAYVYYYVCIFIHSCDISHAKSLTAVQVVLEFIGSAVPQLQQTMSAMLEAVHKSQVYHYYSEYTHMASLYRLILQTKSPSWKVVLTMKDLENYLNK